MIYHNTELFGFKKSFREIVKIYEKNNLPSKIIFSGKKGIGKFQFVMHLINYILSKKEDYPYNLDENFINFKNKSFNLIKNNSHPNFYIIKKSQDKRDIDISQIRNLNNFVNKSSFNNHLKIVLIEDIENLSLSSSNALLKLIEEPNKKVQYFLIHDNSKYVIDTIKSRCINFKLFLDCDCKDQIVNKYFDSEIYSNLNDEFKYYYLSPGDIIGLVKLSYDIKFDINKIKIEELLQYIINQNLYKNKNVSIYFLKILIELLFITKYKSSKNENILKLSQYFNRKFSKMINFNLDLETFFIEFRSKVLNEK